MPPSAPAKTTCDLGAGCYGAVAHYHHDRDEPEQVPAAEGYAHQCELRDLLAAIATGSEPENSGVNGV